MRAASKLLAILLLVAALPLQPIAQVFQSIDCSALHSQASHAQPQSGDAPSFVNAGEERTSHAESCCPASASMCATPLRVAAGDPAAAEFLLALSATSCFPELPGRPPRA